jgi:AbrB family looped-hinge helix DNA binding protein
MIMKESIIQANGQVTLPKSFRRRYNLQRGDKIVFKETASGELQISPKDTLVLNKMAALGEALKAKGITLEELIAEGEAIRQEMYEERLEQRD